MLPAMWLLIVVYPMGMAQRPSITMQPMPSEGGCLIAEHAIRDMYIQRSDLGRPPIMRCPKIWDPELQGGSR